MTLPESVFLLSDSQLKAELMRCEYCQEKPCKEACPADCSPADFIMAARIMEPQDFLRSAAAIMKNNPLGGICGMVCPDRHCMSECSRKMFDRSINIPDMQAEIIKRAKDSGQIPGFSKSEPNGKKIAVIGAGPAGFGAAAVLSQLGYGIVIYEARNRAGGMCRLIPDHRLDKTVLDSDIEFLKSLGDISIKTDAAVEEPEALLSEKYDSVIVCTGLWDPIMPGVPGEERAITALDYLSDPQRFKFSGKLGIIGGGATALDCAVIAVKRGATGVEMFALENISEMPLTEKERREIIEYEIEISPRTKILSIDTNADSVTGISTVKVSLEPEKEFDLKHINEVAQTQQKRNDISHVIIAIGNRGRKMEPANEAVFYAGDCVCGPTTVVEAVASGKNTALEAHSYLSKKEIPKPARKTKSRTVLDGYFNIPVSLETDFFGKEIATPFLLSAAPPSDGYDQMKKAYEVGWTGGVMKTAFDNIPIHIPDEYMHMFNDRTYGNCDNVSGHSLERVCREVDALIKEFPDRLTMASTGGPVTGNDEQDMKVWQSNTRKLESAGAMGIEFSLSCPQGGEGAEGDIVSQSPGLTAKVIDWVMQVSAPEVPKLFKLTAAVTSIDSIVQSIKAVLGKYPDKKAGITLANTFPVMDFQSRRKKAWEDGVVLGMSGESVTPISYFTLARAVPSGIYVSGNGGVMNYRQTANFLALGAATVQFCTIVMKYGYDIFSELCNGVSYLMHARSIRSMKDLIGIAQPDAVTDFMDLSSEKKISSVTKEMCLNCGNCVRCPYLAVTLDEEGFPVTDHQKCIGCSICTKKCFSGALRMRERTPEEVCTEC